MSPGRDPLNPRRRGLTLVEVLVSMVLVSGLVVASMNTLGAARTAGQITADRGRAQLLAIDLLSEIMQANYSEPDAGQQELGLPLRLGLPLLADLIIVLGLDDAERSTDRTTFDDVDDYNNLVESPPVYRDGTPIPGFAGWSRCVEVEYVFPPNLNLESAEDRGVKRITVTVKRGTEELAKVFGLRAGRPAGSNEAIH